MKNRIALIAAVAAVVAGGSLVAAPAFADQVAREQVTLGKLADVSDRIVLAHVSQSPSGRTRVDVDDAIRGARTAFEVTLAAEDKVGDRALVFASKKGEVHAIPVASDADAKALAAAARSRLVTVGGDSDGLRKALLDQLASRCQRVREDAAYDLAAQNELKVDDAARAAIAGALEAALAAHESPRVLLGLAARAPSVAVIAPAVQAGLAATDDFTLDAAARAIRAVSGGVKVAATSLAESLSGERAAQAHRLLGRVGGESAVPALTKALASESSSLRRAAIDGLSNVPDDRAAAVSALEGVVAAPRAVADARLALAGLALLPEGAPRLAAIARDGKDESTRRLADLLTKNPVQTAKRIQLDPTKDPSDR